MLILCSSVTYLVPIQQSPSLTTVLRAANLRPKPTQTRPPPCIDQCSHVARCVAFVAGSVEALLLFVTLLDERLLERDLFGRQLVW